MSVRPAFRSLYENSTLLPLHSGRGLVLAGAGFLYLFKLSNLFMDIHSTPAMDLQLIWSNIEVSPVYVCPCFFNEAERKLI